MGDGRAISRAKAASPTEQERTGLPVAGSKAMWQQPLESRAMELAGSLRAFGHIDCILVTRPGERGLHVSGSASQLVTSAPWTLTSDPRS